MQPNIAANQARVSQMRAMAGQNFGDFATSIQSTVQDSKKKESIYAGLQKAVSTQGAAAGVQPDQAQSLLKDLAPREGESGAEYEARVANDKTLTNIAHYIAVKQQDPSITVDSGAMFAMPEADFLATLNARGNVSARNRLLGPSAQTGATAGLPAGSTGAPIEAAPTREPGAAAANITARTPTAVDGLPTTRFGTGDAELESIIGGVGKPKTAEESLDQMVADQQTQKQQKASLLDEIFSIQDEGELLKHRIQNDPDALNDTSLYGKAYQLQAQRLKEKQAETKLKKSEEIKTNEEIRKERAKQAGTPPKERDKKTVSWQQYETAENQLSRLKNGYVDDLGNKVGPDPGQYQIKAKESAMNLISHNLEVGGEDYEAAQQAAIRAVDQSVVRNDESQNPLITDKDGNWVAFNIASPVGFQMVLAAAQAGVSGTDALNELRKKKGLNPTRQW
jgi:hypothetical protein